jgi:hypothetical protein
MGFTIRFIEAGTAERLKLYIKAPTTEYTITDANTFSKKVSDIKGKDGGYSYTTNYSVDRREYQDAAEDTLTEVDEVVSGDGGNNLTPPNNLVYLYRDISAANVGLGYTFWLSATPATNGTMSWELVNERGALDTKILAETSDWDSTEYETAVDNANEAYLLSNKMDLIKRINYIVSEVAP